VLRETNFFDYFYFSNFREYFVGNIAIQERKKKKKYKTAERRKLQKKTGIFLLNEQNEHGEKG